MHKEMTTRAIELRAANIDHDTRTIEARAVPYSEEYQQITRNSYERFAQDALVPDELGVKLCYEHNETIGKIETLDHREDGAYIKARISQTTTGEDAYTLARDGVLTSMSIGFIPDQYDIEEREDGIYVTHTRATLKEVSLVSFPAYKKATVTNVRNAQNNRKETPVMTDTMQTALDEISRKVDLLEARTATPEPAPTFNYRSAGEYLKAVAAGDEKALMFTRDDTTGTGDASTAVAALFTDTATRPAWVEKTLMLMQAKQTLTNLFEHTYDLPSDGNTLEYPEMTLKTNTVTAGKQENELDELSHGTISLANAAAPVLTYGGYSSVSRQVVERSGTRYLSALHQAQAVAYASAIEEATRDLFGEVYESRKTDGIKAGKTLANITADNIIGVLCDIAEEYDKPTAMFPLTGLICSYDVFKALALLDKKEKALNFTGADNDKVGTLTFTGAKGNLVAIDVTPVALDKTGLLAAYSTPAIAISESSGAPFRVSQEDNIKLANSFSVYGYAAHYAPAPQAILPITFQA